MEKKKLLFPLDLQLFAENEEKEDEDELSLEDDDFTEDDNEKSDSDDQHTDDEEKNSVKKKQSQEENARQAKIRREKEQKEREAREEKIRKEAYEKGKLDATKINPFTNKPIEDKYDLKILEIQKRIKENGGDPIEDLPLELAKLEREEDHKKNEAAKAKEKEDEYISKDISDFRSKYKDVDLKVLLNDPLFNKFSSGKLGNGKDSFIRVYEDFLEFKELVTKSKKDEDSEKEEDNEAKKRGSAPSSNGGKTKDAKTSYSKLSKEERIKELRKQGLIR